MNSVIARARWHYLVDLLGGLTVAGAAIGLASIGRTLSAHDSCSSQPIVSL